MVEQNNAPVDQTKHEIAEVDAIEIARSRKLAKKAEKAVGNRLVSPQGQNGDLVSSDEDGGDSATSGGTTQSSADLTE
jgi:hypothetical protein